MCQNILTCAAPPATVSAMSSPASTTMSATTSPSVLHYQTKATSCWRHPQNAPESRKVQILIKNRESDCFVYSYFVDSRDLYMQITKNWPPKLHNPSPCEINSIAHYLSSAYSPHRTPGTHRTSIYSKVAHKPCFYEISLLKITQRAKFKSNALLPVNLCTLSHCRTIVTKENLRILSAYTNCPSNYNSSPSPPVKSPKSTCKRSGLPLFFQHSKPIL